MEWNSVLTQRQSFFMWNIQLYFCVYVHLSVCLMHTVCPVCVFVFQCTCYSYLFGLFFFFWKNTVLVETFCRSSQDNDEAYMSNSKVKVQGFQTIKPCMCVCVCELQQADVGHGRGRFGGVASEWRCVCPRRLPVQFSGSHFTGKSRTRVHLHSEHQVS